MSQPSDSALAELTQALAANAERYDRSAQFPHDNFHLLHRHGLLALTVPRALGGGGTDLASARRVIGAVGKGDPATALILVMQYLQHFRLQDEARWPEPLRQRVAYDAVRHGALINALRVEPELGTPARGGLPATVARRTAEGWRLSGRKIYSTGSHGLTWYLVWGRSDDNDPLVGGFLVHRDTPGITIIDDWDHLGMRATCSHEVRFDDVLIPLDHAVSVSPASAPKAELDGESLLWMAVLLPAVYDGVARAARDWLAGFLKQRTPSNLGRRWPACHASSMSWAASTPCCSPTRACSTVPPPGTSHPSMPGSSSIWSAPTPSRPWNWPSRPPAIPGCRGATRWSATTAMYSAAGSTPHRTMWCSARSAVPR